MIEKQIKVARQNRKGGYNISGTDTKLTRDELDKLTHLQPEALWIIVKYKQTDENYYSVSRS
jgi:hypothetical protein